MADSVAVEYTAVVWLMTTSGPRASFPRDPRGKPVARECEGWKSIQVGGVEAGLAFGSAPPKSSSRVSPPLLGVAFVEMPASMT